MILPFAFKPVTPRSDKKLFPAEFCNQRCDWISLRFTCQNSDDMGRNFATVIFSFVLSLDNNKPKIKLQVLLIFCLSFNKIKVQ